MLTSNDITELLSGFYRDCSLKYPGKMMLVAEMLETIRRQLETRAPHEAWDYADLDKDKFDSDDFIGVLTNLRQAFFELLFEKQFNHVSDTFATDPAEAFKLLRQYYAEALVNFREDFICLLPKQSFPPNTDVEDWIKKVSPVARYLSESRWVDVLPFYQEVYNDSSINILERCMAETVTARIIFYNFPDPLQAEPHLKNATALLPNDLIVKRAWGEFYQKNGELPRARECYLEVISKEAHEYNSYNFIGDCFFEETKQRVEEQKQKKEDGATEPVGPVKPGNEEFWYNEGLRVNFLQTESLKGLINVYMLDPGIFSVSEEKVNALLNEAKKINYYPQKKRYRFTEKKFAECFNDANFYFTLKAVATNYQGLGLKDKAEEMFKEAIRLQPKLTPAYLDLASHKLGQNQVSAAKKYIDKALQLDDGNYDVYWGLADYFDRTKNKEEAIKAYQKCLELRPSWSDWVNNFIGNVYFDHEEYDNAESYYRKSMEDNPGLKVYQDNLWLAIQSGAEQLEDKGSTEEAIAKYRLLAEHRKDAKDWNKLGNMYYWQRQYSEAEKYYRIAIDRLPDEAIYHENLGLAFEKQGHYDDAEKEFRVAITKNVNEKDGGSYNQLGLYYYGLEKNDQALEQYEHALKREPANVNYLVNIALVHERKKEIDRALQYYQEAEKAANSDDLQNKIGLMYYRQGEHEKAIEYFKKAAALNKKNPVYLENIASSSRILGKMDQAEKNLLKAVELKPDDDFAYNELGRIYFERKDYDKAIEFCRKAIEFEAGNFQYYENLGFAYRDKKEPDTAIQYFRKAVELNAGADMSYSELGWIYINKKDFANAIDCFRQALLLNPDSYRYNENLGFGLKDGDKPDEAIAYFTKAMEIEPNADLSVNELGKIYYERKDYQKAVEFFEKATVIRPVFPNYFMNLAYAFNNLGDKEKAELNFKKALELDPGDQASWGALGRVYFDQGRFDDAVALMKDALSKNPGIAMFYTNLAIAYKHSKKYPEAIAAFQESLKLDDGDYLNWNDLGELYLLQNESSQAVDAYDKAIAIQPADKTLYSNKAIALIQMGKLKDAEQLVNSDQLDDLMRKQFMDQMKILFPEVQIDQDAGNKLVIHAIENQV